jgi:hypothetical protein
MNLAWTTKLTVSLHGGGTDPSGTICPHIRRSTTRVPRASFARRLSSCVIKASLPSATSSVCYGAHLERYFAISFGAHGFVEIENKTANMLVAQLITEQCTGSTLMTFDYSFSHPQERQSCLREVWLMVRRKIHLNLPSDAERKSFGSRIPRSTHLYRPFLSLGARDERKNTSVEGFWPLSVVWVRRQQMVKTDRGCSTRSSELSSPPKGP